MPYSVDLLNAIRAEASTEYQTYIPEASRENFAAVGQAFKTYTTLYNEFCSALMNKVGRTIISNKMWKNKLARFKSGAIAEPHDVEEIFVEMLATSGTYDKNGTNPHGRRDPAPVKVAYHRQNREGCYDISLGDIDFRRVFRTPETFDTFMTAQLNSVYRRDEKDEFISMKNVLATFKNLDDSSKTGYFDYEVPTIEAAGGAQAFAKTFIKTLRKAVQDVGFLSTKYNAAGVETYSNPGDLVLLVNKDVLVECDVEQLATAFHQSETDMKVVPTIVSMDDFGTLAGTYGLLVDKEFFRVWDTLVHMEPQRNAQGLFTNWFYHHHQILSASPFVTAIRFKAGA